jgi:hypothetical protein
MFNQIKDFFIGLREPNHVLSIYTTKKAQTMAALNKGLLELCFSSLVIGGLSLLAMIYPPLMMPVAGLVGAEMLVGLFLLMKGVDIIPALLLTLFMTPFYARLRGGSKAGVDAGVIASFLTILTGWIISMTTSIQLGMGVLYTSIFIALFSMGEKVVKKELNPWVFALLLPLVIIVLMGNTMTLMGVLTTLSIPSALFFKQKKSEWYEAMDNTPTNAGLIVLHSFLIAMPYEAKTKWEQGFMGVMNEIIAMSLFVVSSASRGTSGHLLSRASVEVSPLVFLFMGAAIFMGSFLETNRELNAPILSMSVNTFMVISMGIVSLPLMGLSLLIGTLITFMGMDTKVLTRMLPIVGVMT